MADSDPSLPWELQPLSAHERRRLIPSLSTRIQLEQLERRSIHAARIWAMRRAHADGHSVLTEDFARDIHRRMFGGIWRGAGRYRTEPDPDGWEPAQISEGVRMILDDAEGWLRYGTYELHEAAVRLHYRLWCVRPWGDGNGNHARLMADVYVEAAGEEPLTWGMRTHAEAIAEARRRYAEATLAARAGDMSLMLDFART